MIIAQKGAGELVTEILMSMQNWTGSFLVVEGDGDSKFWRVWKDAACDLVISTGRGVALEALQRLQSLSVSKTIGIVDDDQDSLRGTRSSCPLAIYTHCADLEVCQFMTSSLDRVLIEFGDETKIRNFESAGQTVREHLLSLAADLGKVRFLNRISPTPISLRGLNVRRFVDDDLRLDHGGVDAFAVSGGMFPDYTSLIAAKSGVPVGPDWLFAQGHDLVDLLTLSLEKKFGSVKAGRDRVASHLRMSVQESELLAWPIYTAIKAHEVAQGTRYIRI